MERKTIIFWRNLLGIAFLLSLLVIVTMFISFLVFDQVWKPFLTWMHLPEMIVANSVFLLFNSLVFLFSPMVALHMMAGRKQLAERIKGSEDLVDNHYQAKHYTYQVTRHNLRLNDKFSFTRHSKTGLRRQVIGFPIICRKETV